MYGEREGVYMEGVECACMGRGCVYGRGGVHAAPSKVEAHAPNPRNVTELRSFFGMINYYGKFIPNLSSIYHPLNNLLWARQKWKWTK